MAHRPCDDDDLDLGLNQVSSVHSLVVQAEGFQARALAYQVNQRRSRDAFARSNVQRVEPRAQSREREYRKVRHALGTVIAE